MPALTTQIRHSHNLDHQTRPARKMLRALPFTRLGIILFPRKARLLPTLINSIDQVIAEFGVDFSCASTMGTRLSRDVLEISIVSKDETAWEDLGGSKGSDRKKQRKRETYK